ASTGNTAASAAAYAARAVLEAIVVHAAGGPSSSKLAQVRVTGARLVEIEGTFDDAFAAAEELAEREGAVVVNSTNPDRIEGQKTAALEIVEQLGGLPDVLALPYGGGGNTVAYAKGFLEAGFPALEIVPVEAPDRAPATTANLGAGFDCAGAALDLWNELELSEDGGDADAGHLAVRAFARLASPDGFGFTFTERIPRARGLGSSAATIALGLVA